MEGTIAAILLSSFHKLGSDYVLTTPDGVAYRPLVAGTSETDQLDRIFRLLGTPTTADYPGIVELPEYSADQFPPYPPPRGGLASLVPTLDATGVDLLTKMVQYDPSRRITAQAALEHPFFAEMKGAGR